MNVFQNNWKKIHVDIKFQIQSLICFCNLIFCIIATGQTNKATFEPVKQKNAILSFCYPKKVNGRTLGWKKISLLLMKPCDKMFDIGVVKKDDGRPLLLLSHFLKRWGGIIGTTAKQKINRQIIERRGVNGGQKSVSVWCLSFVPLWNHQRISEQDSTNCRTLEGQFVKRSFFGWHLEFSIGFRQKPEWDGDFYFRIS